MRNEAASKSNFTVEFHTRENKPRGLVYGGTAHKYCTRVYFTSRGVRLALGKSNELGIRGASGPNGVW